MSVFAGIVRLNGEPGGDIEDRLVRAISGGRADAVAVHRLAGALFVRRVTPHAGWPRDRRAIVARDKRLFVARARIDNRGELLAALGRTDAGSDGDILLAILERWGDDGLARCLGAFALALWDGEARRLTMARDCIGNESLFFHRGDDFVAFATALPILLAIPAVPRAVDEIALADFLAVNLRDPHRTFYRGIARVPSRSLVEIGRGGLSHRHYWSPRLAATPLYVRDEDYVARARELLDQSVGAALAGRRTIAIFASGGLDSSAIAATAARIGGAENISCYTLAPPDDLAIEPGAGRYLDERDKMHALARMYPGLGLKFVESTTVHPFEEDDTRQFVRTGMPALAPTLRGLYHHLIDAVSGDGHRTVLTGQYGNFGLSWPGRATAAELLREGHWRTFANRMVPVAWQRRLMRLRGRDPDSVAAYCALNADFIAAHDLAARWRAQGFSRIFARPEGDSRQARARMMFDRNQFSRDNHATAKDFVDFEICSPLADRRLLEFTLNVPEAMFRRGGVPRSFARAVLADRLPAEILQERRRGAQDVTWFRRLDLRRKDISAELDRLDGSPLARRLLDLPRLKRLMDDWPADERIAERRKSDFRATLAAGVHVGRFIRWVEGGNA